MERFAERRDAAPTGGRLTEVAGFGTNPGALRMMTYSPPGLRSGAPLVVVLHGCGQSAEALAVGAGWTELADRGGFALLCPEQTRSNNRGRCFNWFQASDVRREGGEAGSIQQMIDHFSAHARLDRRRVFVTGLSAGGSMALALVATRPDLFAGAGVIAAVPYGAASNPGEALLAMTLGASSSGLELADAMRRASRHTKRWPPLAVWQGLADRTVAPANARRIIAQWVDLLGLHPAPADVETLPRQTVTRWRNGAGRAILELHLVESMAHGVPLSAAGPGAVGREGAFLLETGVSSTLEMARFWGLIEPSQTAAKVRTKPGTRAPPRQRRSIGARLLAFARRLMR
jgi:poly(hydroxyalkanoate) depolymerase family esterase